MLGGQQQREHGRGQRSDQKCDGGGNSRLGQSGFFHFSIVFLSKYQMCFPIICLKCIVPTSCKYPEVNKLDGSGNSEFDQFWQN